MKTNARYFLSCDRGIYCKDGKFRHVAWHGTFGSCVKFWKSRRWAEKTADKLRLQEFRTTALYAGDTYHADGTVTRKGEE